MPASRLYDVIILGGGAAGLFCAGIAAQRGKDVLVLERNAEVGAKILISGGGRCNFTNLHTAADRFLSDNPHFVHAALAGFSPRDFIARVEKHGVAYYEKTLGQLFCQGPGSAKKIVRLLLDEARGAEIRTGCAVGAVTRADRFSVETDQGVFETKALVLATGGLSIPKLGASDLGYRLAAQFGLKVVAPRPGLVPLTLGGAEQGWTQLAGVAAEVRAHADGPAFREAALFTHRGLSGPAILQASSYWRPGLDVRIDWLPDQGPDALIAAKRARPKALLKSVLADWLPDRLAGFLAGDYPPREMGDWRDEALMGVGQRLKSFGFHPSGTEGYAKAEVTLGGVDTRALAQRSMAAPAIPGLYVIGELVDVTGWLGGYNFQWAWASGHAAGIAIP